MIRNLYQLQIQQDNYKVSKFKVRKNFNKVGRSGSLLI